MPAVFLIFPFFVVRFLLPPRLDKTALQRAAHFAPMKGAETIAYILYQLSTLGIFLPLLFIKVPLALSWSLFAGLFCYLCGLAFCAASVIGFSSPDGDRLRTGGVYRFSRNPMYLSYFICFLGMALLTQSLLVLGAVLLFQGSAHWIILAEERWCISTFGSDYQRYMQRVRRYF